MSELLGRKRGLLGIKFWFMVFVVMAFMVAVSMAMNILYVGQTVRAADELGRIKTYLEAVCHGNVGDYRTFGAPPFGVIVRVDSCDKVLAKSAVRGVVGVGVMTKHITSIANMGKKPKALKQMADKADDLAKMSGSNVKTATNAARITEANQALTKNLAMFKDPSKRLFQIPVPSKMAGVHNKVVMALDKTGIVSANGAKAQKHIVEIYKIQGQLGRTKDAAQAAKLYAQWGNHADEAYKLAHTAGRFGTGMKFTQGALYTTCVGTSLAGYVKEVDVVPEGAQKAIEDVHTATRDFISDNAGPAGGTVGALPAEGVPCLAYSLSRGASLKGATGFLGGAVTSTAFNILGGRMLGQSAAMISSFATRCPGASNGLAICVQKSKCEGDEKGPCSACEVISCRVPIKVESRPFDPKITVSHEGDVVKLNGGVEPF
ncbi:MAG: hypothetical protein QGG50_07840 [Methanopyri archaeon]|jgi:hypothetical protein|nr:hypothetical protein [Methanopyri archaeon]